MYDPSGNDYVGNIRVSYNASLPSRNWFNDKKAMKSDYALNLDMYSEDNLKIYRIGVPSETLDFDKLKPEVDRCLDHYWTHGWYDLPKNLPDQLFRSLNLFRTTLECWELNSKLPAWMPKEELYVGALEQGPFFNEFIKKARAAVVQELTAVTETTIPEGYEDLSDGYKGYDSILSERNFPHWIHKDVDDIKYAFRKNTIPFDEEDFLKRCDHYFEKYKIVESFKGVPDIDWRDAVGPNVVYCHSQKRTILQRELLFMNELPERMGWFARRCVVQALPGGPRDTGVPDFGTWKKIKRVNAFAHQLNSIFPTSAMAPSWEVLKRYKEICKAYIYIHIDFKKYGLTSPRDRLISFAKYCERKLEVDLHDIHEIHDFTILFEDGTLRQTCNGTMLGWIDSFASLVTQIDLEWFIHERNLPVKMIGFADDYELGLSKTEHDIQWKSDEETIKTADVIIGDVCMYLRESGWLPSDRKIYGSKMSIFLENYVHDDRVGLDMYKGQLTAINFAKAIVTKSSARARDLYAGAAAWNPNPKIDDYVSRNRKWLRDNEFSQSVLFAGWQPQQKGLLVEDLEEASLVEIAFLAVCQQKLKILRFTTKRREVDEGKERDFLFKQQMSWSSNHPPVEFDMSEVESAYRPSPFLLSLRAKADLLLADNKFRVVTANRFATAERFDQAGVG
jgi:hypothetical protein